MKNIISIILFSIIIFNCNKANALTFEEAYNQIYSKPAAVLVYADWADNYQNCLQQFKIASQKTNKINFVAIDIAEKTAKAYNSKYEIFQNLPYILLIRNGGKVTRVLPRSCASNNACITQKINAFIQ